MAAADRTLLLDDRLLIEELLVGLPIAAGRRLATTSSWWFRACRAAVAGAGGYLSGPFDEVDAADQGEAVLRLLDLRDDIELVDPRKAVPEMARASRRHPRLNLLNLDALAAATVLDAEVALAPKGAAGLLPVVLAEDGRPWREVEVPY